MKKEMHQKKVKSNTAAEKFESSLDSYRNWVSVDSSKARACIMKLDYKKNFYLLQCIAQTYLDESRFVDGSNKMQKAINQRKWRMAESYIISSFRLEDDNAEVLYTMGEIRKLSRQADIATYCFKRIIKLGVDRISKQQYSRGRSFAKMLINDARFELYRIYFHSDPKKSAKYLGDFKAHLEKGVETIFHPLKKFLLQA